MAPEGTRLNVVWLELVRAASRRREALLKQVGTNDRFLAKTWLILSLSLRGRGLGSASTTPLGPCHDVMNSRETCATCVRCRPSVSPCASTPKTKANAEEQRKVFKFFLVKCSSVESTCKQVESPAQPSTAQLRKSQDKERGAFALNVLLVSILQCVLMRKSNPGRGRRDKHPNPCAYFYAASKTSFVVVTEPDLSYILKTVFQHLRIGS